MTLAHKGEMAHKSELERLNIRYRPALMAFFMRRAATLADAEDMTQDVFMRLAAARAQDVTNTDAYIFQIAANLLRDKARKERVRTAAALSMGEFADIETLDPSRFLLGREQLEVVTAYLSELPERTRNLFILFRVEGIGQAQLALSYDISTRAVQKHILKAMTHIMRRLEEGGRLS